MTNIPVSANMNDVAEPRLSKETLSGFRIYGKNDEEEEEIQYLSLWVVHGPPDGRQVEYPLVAYAADQTTFSSADPSFGEIDGHLVDEEFYRFLAGQMARLAEEGEHVIWDLFAFAPEEWEYGEAYLVQQMIFMCGKDGGIPFEVDWAIRRGVELIEEELDVDEAVEEIPDE